MRAVVVCLAALLAAGCESEKKPTEPSAPAPPFPDRRPPGKKQTGPGMSRLPAAPAVGAADRNS